MAAPRCNRASQVFVALYYNQPTLYLLCVEAQNEVTGIAVAMEKYKVLFIHKFFTTGGGVERVHKNLSQALSDEGVTSVFYVHDVTGESKEGFDQLQNSFSAFSADSNNGFRQKLSYLFLIIRKFID